MTANLRVWLTSPIWGWLGGLAVLAVGFGFLGIAVSGWAVGVEGPDARDWTPWTMVGLVLAWAVVQLYIVPGFVDAKPRPADRTSPGAGRAVRPTPSTPSRWGWGPTPSGSLGRTVPAARRRRCPAVRGPAGAASKGCAAPATTTAHPRHRRAAGRRGCALQLPARRPLAHSLHPSVAEDYAPGRATIAGGTS